MDKQKIKELYDKLYLAMAELKGELKETVINTQPLTGVTQISDTPTRAVNVSFSAIAHNNCILSAAYYCQDTQNKAVCSYILKEDLSLDTMKQRIDKAIKKKSIPYQGDNIPLNPNTLATLMQIQTELA